MRKPNRQDKPLNDLSRSLTPLDVNQTLIAVIELSKESWLVAGIIPGVERQPLKKLLADEDHYILLQFRVVSQLHPVPRHAAAARPGSRSRPSDQKPTLAQRRILASNQVARFRLTTENT
jgi:hypothetical protein